VKHSAVFTCALMVWSCAHAEVNYYLERCAISESKLNLRFVGTGNRVRRIYLGPTGGELGGNMKGVLELGNIRELNLDPKFKVVFVSGESVEFGPLTPQCRGKVREVAKRLSIVVRGTDG
jgi:hypothetical protein